MGARMDASVGTRPAMTTEQPADVAVAAVLLTQLDGVETNLVGTLADTDPEYLHDLRVGIRRTRSLLKLTGDVLPRRLAPRYAARFRWLGDLTTPVRDLDVHLLAFDDLAAEVPTAHRRDLEPFREHLRRQRSTHFEALIRGLASSRFTTLRERWPKELSAVADVGAASGPRRPTAGELAADRLGRARKAVRKRARAVAPASPAEDVHDLRKRAKELRYLLETFAPLYGKRARKAVKDLKGLQNVLGAFQDAQVQLMTVTEYADGLTAVPPGVYELASVLDRRLLRARIALVPRLDAFLAAPSMAKDSPLVPRSK
jgi:CHAD domain-containing protein